MRKPRVYYYNVRPLQGGFQAEVYRHDAPGPFAKADIEDVTQRVGQLRTDIAEALYDLWGMMDKMSGVGTCYYGKDYNPYAKLLKRRLK